MSYNKSQMMSLEVISTDTDQIDRLDGVNEPVFAGTRYVARYVVLYAVNV